MKLPFGKKVMLGGFYVLKHTKSLTSAELKKLRKASNIPADVQKHLDRKSLPYITISTMSDSWRIEFVIGTGMYEAIDELPVAVDSEGVYTYYGNARVNFGNIVNGWFAYTGTVGDAEYQAAVVNAMQDYLKRASEKGKDTLGEEENGKVMDDELEREEHKSLLKSMSNDLKKSEENG